MITGRKLSGLMTRLLVRKSVARAALVVIGLHYGIAVTAASHPSQPISWYKRAANACFNFAKQHAMPPMSVAVVDAHGAVIAFEAQAGAARIAREVAVLKAASASRSGLSTSALRAEQEHDPEARDLFILLTFTTIPGGVPISSGGIGVSGSVAELDEQCARAAARAIQEDPAR